jgi:hypothetical protein
LFRTFGKCSLHWGRRDGRSPNFLLILKPDTLLRWHRQEFRLFWKFKSRKRGSRPKLSIETINLIQQMARENSF